MDKLRKIRRHQLKERLKISKIAQFESVSLKTNKGIAPHSGEILHKLASTKVSQLSGAASSLA